MERSKKEGKLNEAKKKKVEQKLKLGSKQKWKGGAVKVKICYKTLTELVS